MAINNIDENNAARERLLGQLRNGRLIGCTGAGLSAWAGYRCWTDLIRRLAEEVERRRPGGPNAQIVFQILENHEAGDLLVWARRLGTDLGEASFAEFIQAEFGPTGREPNEVLLRIAALPLRHILTLNFDLSCEAAHALVGAGCQTITSCNRSALARFLRDMDNPGIPKQIVHLHGKFDDPIQQIALTETGYAALYDPFFRLFVSNMATRRLLFLGFGFTDTDFTDILRKCARHVRAAPNPNDVDPNDLNHFALIGLRPEENDNQRRAELTERFLLDPVFYEVAIRDNGQEDHQEFANTINAIAAALALPEQRILQQVAAVPPIPAQPLNPDDERRAEELTQRLLDRIEPGGDRV